MFRWYNSRIAFSLQAPIWFPTIAKDYYNIAITSLLLKSKLDLVSRSHVPVSRGGREMSLAVSNLLSTTLHIHPCCLSVCKTESMPIDRNILVPQQDQQGCSNDWQLTSGNTDIKLSAKARASQLQPKSNSLIHGIQASFHQEPRSGWFIEVSQCWKTSQTWKCPL